MGEEVRVVVVVQAAKSGRRLGKAHVPAGHGRGVWPRGSWLLRV